MTSDELASLNHHHKLREALVTFDSLSMEWVVDFRTGEQDLFPLTDAKGCRVSFTDERSAEQAIARFSSCPVHIADHQRDYDA